jgi:hypothetical protein
MAHLLQFKGGLIGRAVGCCGPDSRDDCLTSGPLAGETGYFYLDAITGCRSSVVAGNPEPAWIERVEPLTFLPLLQACVFFRGVIPLFLTHAREKTFYPSCRPACREVPPQSWLDALE